MKQQIEKWIKEYWGTMCLLAAVLLLCVTGSLAAYTNFSSARRVISVKTEDRVLFSSNLLYSEDKNTESSSYKYKKIVLTGSNNFVVEVYNYNLGDTATYNNKNITYTLKATVYTGNASVSEYIIQPETGNSVGFSDTGSEGIFTAELTGQMLSGSSLSKKRYTFSVPETDKDNVKVCVEAIPEDNGSYEATNQKKLAAFIITGERTAQKTWSGRFLDEQTGREPNQYDGFNYEIAGNGQGTVTMTWNPQILKISPWFEEKVDSRVMDSEGKKSITFSVGGENQPSAYQTQFYKAEGWNAQTTWSELSDKNTISITFSESAGS